MKLTGVLVIIVGIFLFASNVIGFFRTFPLAGYLTITVGGFYHESRR